MSDSRQNPVQEHWTREAFFDFKLSREAKNCSPATLEWYDYTAGMWAEWLIDQGVDDPEELSARHVRAYQSELRERGLADTTLHGRARAIKTFTKFLRSEGYIPEPISIDMPKVGEKRLLVLDAEEVKTLLSEGCRDARDKAVVQLLVDTGLRRAEAVALNWEDVDLRTGIIRVREGKGGKSRSVMISPSAQRALLKYRRTVPHAEDDPVIVSKRGGGRLTGQGLRNLLRRMGKRAGVKVTPHSLRRTFATLALANGMDSLHLRDLLGHEDLEMVRRYARLVDVDLKRAHDRHSPLEYALNGGKRN